MVQWHLIGRMVLQYLQLSGYTLGEGWLECFCLLSAWHLIDSPVEMYWQAQWLSIGNWHWRSDNKVASDWQSSGIRMASWHILVEWQSSCTGLAINWQSCVSLGSLSGIRLAQ